MSRKRGLASFLYLGRKRIPSSSVENVASTVIEVSSQSPLGTISVQVVFRVLDVRYSTRRKIYSRILHFYPYEIKYVHQLQAGDSEVRKIFYLNSLFEWRLTSLGHGIFCGVMKPTFTLVD